MIVRKKNPWETLKRKSEDFFAFPFFSAPRHGDVYKLLGWLNIDNIQGHAESCLGKAGKVMNKAFQVKGSAQCSVRKGTNLSHSILLFFKQLFRSTKKMWKREINFLNAEWHEWQPFHVTPLNYYVLLSQRKKKMLYHKACLPVACRQEQAALPCKTSKSHTTMVTAAPRPSSHDTPWAYDITRGPVHDNAIPWPCLSSGSRKYKSVSVCDRPCRHIIYLWCTARNRTTTFMSIMQSYRYDQTLFPLLEGLFFFCDGFCFCLPVLGPTLPILNSCWS